MNYNDKNKKIALFLIFIIVTCVSLIGIILLKEIKNNTQIRANIEKNISASGWPKEVPIIKNEFISISKQSEKSWKISIDKPVTYDLFKNYLIELYDEGFKPIAETGSKSPKLLSLQPPQEDGFILFWSGKSEEYTVEAFWQENEYIEGSTEFSNTDEPVTIFLYSNFESNENAEKENESEKNILDYSGDNYFNISGEIGVNSGEATQNVEVSGENSTVSGD